MRLLWNGCRSDFDYTSFTYGAVGKPFFDLAAVTEM